MEQAKSTKTVKIISLLLLTILIMQNAFAQGNPQDVEMADILHQNGKIYLVVFVLTTIFVGIILYLIRLERKLNKLEKN